MRGLLLVLSIVKKFSHRGENLDDLFQVGSLGLLKAIDNFDLEHGVRFSTYAVPMIIGEIRRYLRDNSPIRVSRSMKDIAYKAIHYKDTYLKEHEKGAIKVTPFIDEYSNTLTPNQPECAFMGENIIFQEKKRCFICIET